MCFTRRASAVTPEWKQESSRHGWRISATDDARLVLGRGGLRSWVCLKSTLVLYWRPCFRLLRVGVQPLTDGVL